MKRFPRSPDFYTKISVRDVLVTMVLVGQALVATLLVSFANMILLSLAVVLFQWPQLILVAKSPITTLLAGTLASQAITVALLLLPMWRDAMDHLIQDSSVRLLRIAAVALTLTGLVATTSLLEHENNVRPGCAVAGATTALAAGLALMIVTWPLLDPLVGEDEWMVEPLLSDSEESSDEDDEESQGNLAQPVDVNHRELHDDAYRLLENGDEEQGLDEEQAAEEEPTSRLRGTRRLLQLAKPEMVYLYAGCSVLLLRLPFSLSIPHFVSSTLSAVASGDFARARIEILSLFLAGTIDAFLDFWCVFLFGYANQRIVKGVRNDLFRHLIRQEVSFFDQSSSGELASRLQSDWYVNGCTVNRRQSLLRLTHVINSSEMAGDLTWFFRFSIESVVRITGIASYMLIRSPTLAACALSIAPVVAVVNKWYGNWLSKNATAVQDALAEANSVAQEALANIRTVVAFAAERLESRRYETKIQRQYQLNVRQLFMTGVYYMVICTFLMNTIVQGSLLWVGMVLIRQHRLTAEVLLAFMLYQGQLQSETMNLFQAYSSLIKSSGAGDKVFALLDRKPPPPSINNETVQAEDRSMVGSDDVPNQYTVEFKRVSFYYPSRPQHMVLSQLNLVIPKGATLAIIGKSGCGKSTMIALLQRFYDPTSGSILINDVDLRSMDLILHRRHIGVVTQDPTLFRGTVLENITYGCQATRAEAVEAAKLANAHEFITSFPSGYDTPVGDRGVQLSGGQLQRIALARALVKKPSLLLLDEATSALDNESEQVVQAALDDLLKQQREKSSSGECATTTVIIAHRLRTVRNADIIAVIDKGQVAELGNHKMLMSLNGLYRNMVQHAGSDGVLPEQYYPT